MARQKSFSDGCLESVEWNGGMEHWNGMLKVALSHYCLMLFNTPCDVCTYVCM